MAHEEGSQPQGQNDEQAHDTAPTEESASGPPPKRPRTDAGSVVAGTEGAGNGAAAPAPDAAEKVPAPRDSGTQGQAAPANGPGLPPRYTESDYVAAGDGWWAHKGGQWLYNLEEKTYFHLPTGQLRIAGEDGSTVPMAVESEGVAAPEAQGPKALRGRVRWFNWKKGFGFISPVAGGADVFVHRNQLCEVEDSDIFASLDTGSNVTYMLGQTDEGRACAVDVRLCVGDDKEEEEDEDEAEEEAEEEGGDEENAESGSEVDMDLEEELRCGLYSEKGPGKDHCEDFAVEKLKIPVSVLGETATCIFFAVFDGHGGSSCAEYAHNHLAKNVLARLRDRTKNSSDEVAVRTALVGAFKQTEHNFLQHARRTGDFSGSTACTLTVFGPDERMRLRLFLANCGDSRAVLGKVNGKAFRLTEDHKPNLPAEKKRAELAGGSVGQISGVWRCILPPKRRTGPSMGLAVSRSLGDKEFKGPDIVSAEPEITVYDLDWDTDDFVILASDGVWDVMSDRDAVRLVQQRLRSGETEKKVAEALVKRALEKGSPDDKTALVIRFGWCKSVSGEGDGAGQEGDGNEDDDEEDDEESAKGKPAKAEVTSASTVAQEAEVSGASLAAMPDGARQTGVEDVHEAAASGAGKSGENAGDEEEDEGEEEEEEEEDADLDEEEEDGEDEGGGPKLTKAQLAALQAMPISGAMGLAADSNPPMASHAHHTIAIAATSDAPANDDDDDDDSDDDDIFDRAGLEQDAEQQAAAAPAPLEQIDTLGLFADLGPTQEELAARIGPTLPGQVPEAPASPETAAPTAPAADADMDIFAA